MFCWILIAGGLLIMMGQHDRSEALFYYFRLEDQGKYGSPSLLTPQTACKTIRSCHTPGTKISPHRARYFPLGLPTLGAADQVLRPVNSVSRFTRSSKLSNRTSPLKKHCIRGIRLHKLWQRSRASDYSNWRNGMPCEHRSKADRNLRPIRSRVLCRVE